MTKMRLFCFPYGGAGASAFRTWGSVLPSWIEVVPVQVPGRESRFREAPFTRVEPLVQDLIKAFDGVSGPFALFGHSFGALAAFEIARELRRRGKPSPKAFLVSGLPAPQLERNRPKIAHLPKDELVRKLRDEFDLSPELLEMPEILDMVLPVMRADFEVVETYDYREEPPLDFPIHPFGGQDDREAKADELAAWNAQSTRPPVPVRLFPGDHFYLIKSRDALLAAVAEALKG
jgi:medium-chain acyl-[acyl-carrier-protein] hydrolase